MKLHRLPLIAVAAAAALAQLNAQTTVATDPVGFVTTSIAAGDGTSKKMNLYSVPLFDSATVGGQAAGLLTGVGTTTLSNTNANWTPGELSNITNRFLIQITSGAAAGRLFLVATNPSTANTLTIDGTDITAYGQLNSQGIQAGDSYKIYACDTLSSWFGTPATTGIRGGTNLAQADSVSIMINGNITNYFYHTLSNRWTASRPGNPDASFVPIRPFTGIQYGRLAASNLSLVSVGSVPVTNRVVAIKNSGDTFVAQFWPVATAISNLGFNSLSNWVKGTNAKVADKLLIATNAGATPKVYYFHSISNAWVESRPGNPLSGQVLVPIGSAVQVSKLSTTNPGYTLLNQPLPYGLQ